MASELLKIGISDDEMKGLIAQWVQYPQALSALVADIAQTLHLRVVGRTPRGYRYQKFTKTLSGKERRIRNKGTGRFRKGSWKPTPHGMMAKDLWTPPKGAGSNTFEQTMELLAPYGMVLEEGKYPGVGKGTYPRHTTIAEGGVFSKLAVGGIVQPVIDDVVEGKSTLAKSFETVISDFTEKIGFGK